MSKSIFKPRDTIFCDECHNIPSIVKNNFSPEIKREDLSIFKTIYGYINNAKQLELFDHYIEEQNGKAIEVDIKMKWKDIENIFEKCWETFINPHASIKANDEAIQGYVGLLNLLGSVVENIEADLQYKRQQEIPTKEIFFYIRKLYYSLFSVSIFFYFFYDILRTSLLDTS